MDARTTRLAVTDNRDRARTLRGPRYRRSFFPVLLVLGCVLPLTGCKLHEWAQNGFKVGPNYCRPMAPVASQWIDYEDPRIQSEEVGLGQWWHVLQDPALDSLIDTAYQQNISLRVAGARILEAQAIRGYAVGSLFPQDQYAAGAYSLNKLSGQAAFVMPNPWNSEWDGGLNLAWELDFWGRFRRAVEAADAELDASIENYDDALVTLFAEVATNYTQYRIFQERLAYARNNVKIQEASYELAVNRFKAGAASERDVQQAAQVVAQTKALIPALDAGARLANNALCVLMGMPPEDLVGVLGADGKIPTTPHEAAIGIPADLLARRPDVRRAERQVAAESARIGIAVSEFYPRIGLTGILGVQAEDFDNLFHTPSSMVGAFGPSFRWSILHYGRIANQVAAQDARFQQAAFNYQETVLRAGREAEDAIITFLKAQERTDHLTDSVEAAERTVTITLDQYRVGAVDFTAVYLFQAELAQQQDQLAASRGEITLSLIRLYRSLGGGWEMRLMGSPGPPVALPSAADEEVPTPATEATDPVPPVAETPPASES